MIQRADAKRQVKTFLDQVNEAIIEREGRPRRQDSLTDSLASARPNCVMP
jgi:hypothetical protein